MCIETCGHQEAPWLVLQTEVIMYPKQTRIIVFLCLKARSLYYIVQTSLEFIVDQASLKLTEIHMLLLQVLGLKACTITLGKIHSFFSRCHISALGPEVCLSISSEPLDHAQTLSQRVFSSCPHTLWVCS